MKKLFDKEAAKRFWNNIKKLFLRKPQNEGAAGKYLKYVSEDATEWADFPAFLNYKGIKDTYENLPKSGNVKGDVYTVKDSNSEYFWDQDETWNYIGRLVNMDGYVPLEGDSTITGYVRINGGLTVDADDGPTLTIGAMKGSLNGNFDISDSLIVGKDNETKTGAYHSASIGEGCSVHGEDTVAAGYYLITPVVKGAFACGQYNSIANAPIFSVGNGNSESDRSNIFEINKNNGAFFNTLTTFNNKAYFKNDLTSFSGQILCEGPAVFNGKNIFNGTVDFSNLVTFKNNINVTLRKNPIEIKEGGYYSYDIEQDKIIAIPSLSANTYSKTVIILNNKVSSGSTFTVKFIWGNNQVGNSIQFTKPLSAMSISGKIITIENILGYPIISSSDFSYMINHSSGPVS